LAANGAEAVHATFSFSRPNYDMSRIRALALILCLQGLLGLGLSVAGAGAAWAGGYRFGGWGLGPPLLGAPLLGGPRFGGPNFAGPRYDGPIPYDVEPLPPGEPPDARVVLPAGPPPGPRKCYSSAESRERVASGRLREPLEVMRKASAMTRAEALAVKLCHWNDVDIYEISLLRRDGALIRVFMNAVTGQVIGGPGGH
jgi:hypothetical protein